jgi:hypothetical protein
LVGDGKANSFRHCKPSYGEAASDANEPNSGSCGRRCGTRGRSLVFHVEHQKFHRLICSTWNAKFFGQCAKRGLLRPEELGSSTASH